MADGDFVKGSLTIRAVGIRAQVILPVPSEFLDAPDIIRLGLWLRDNRPQ